MIGIDSRAARYTWTAIVVLLLVTLVYLIQETLFIFVLAILFAYMLWPVVRFLNQKLPGRSKTPALAIVYVLLVGVLALVGFAIGSNLVSEANSLAEEVPTILSRVNQAASVPSGSVSGLKLKILVYARDQAASHSREIVSLLSKGAVTVLSHAEVLLFVVLVPILSFFFLKDGSVLLRDFLDSIREDAPRERAREILSDIHVLLAQYIRALVLLSLAAFAAYTLFLALMRAPYPILLGAIAAPLEFIPMVGPLTGGVLILLVTWLSGYHHVLVILVFLIVYRLFQDYVLSPYLLSAGMELHPLLVIFGVIAGGEIAGVAGAFLSVPVLAVVRIVYRQLKTAPKAPSEEPRITQSSRIV